MTTEDVEDWIYHQLEDTTHLLHGVVHTNGFGHLLRVNGREGGSRVLSGCRIMDFWDRLCKLLGVRKVSLLDVSKKYGLEYRLLYAITKGHPWYGDWGYEFGAGSFALTLDAYKTAVETLSKQPLSNYLSQGRKPRTRLQDLISFYQSLSERELSPARSFGFAPQVPCVLGLPMMLNEWKKQCLEYYAVSGPNWVSWRALRGAVCKVGPPELLDYCLKELKGKQSEYGMVVNARCLPDTGAIEYSCTNSAVTNHPSEEHLLRDLRYLYGSMLHPQTMVLNNAPQANRDLAIISATKLLDCKQFVKDYHPENKLRAENPLAIHLSCEAEVELMEQSEDVAPSPPPELIVLPPNATISDLKFQAEELLGYGTVDESTQIKLLLGGSTESVRVRGICLGKNGMMMSRFRMENGVEPWTVMFCTCGAKDDDAPQLSPSADLSLLSIHSPSPFAHSNMLPQRRADELMAELIHAPILDNGGGGSLHLRLLQQPLLTETIYKTASEIRCPHPWATSLPAEVNVLSNRSACTFSLRCPAPPHRGALQNFRTFLKASPCAPVPLWILQVHPFGIPTLVLRASVQQLLRLSILLATFPISLGNFKWSSTNFKASSLRILHLNETCLTLVIFMDLPSAMRNRTVPLPTTLRHVVRHLYKSLACYMCREHLSISAQVLSNS
ncbi:RING/FYVE/PHD zinc finger superfamily protein [Actinidia rufa]|uniref:RING/FYVE/PHD zinc finger superfamily protein n=1 Tax=Actinidia rufa TaxID=165716 RepID=A0A7J0F5B0_9ERIC|nr:RING/FYVE/PHD zinc finger superfamily protein [Actinidia rufa]